MKKRKLSLMVLGLGVAALLAAVAAPLVVEGGPAGVGALGQRLADTPMGRFLTGQIGELLVLRSKLNVTPEQREQVLRIVQSHRAEIARAAKPVVEKRRVLRDATRALPIDEARIRGAAAELGDALGDLAVVGAKVKAEARQVLTAEQLASIDEFRTRNARTVDEFIERIAKAQ